MFDYDAELQFVRQPFRAACGVRRGEHVLDVGCGGGQTTRDAAADAGTTGRVIGVDVSERLLDQARLQTTNGTIDYLLADASVHDFGMAFDVCISRFGVMFFADPVAAFSNLRRALRPRGRLVSIIWQPRSANEWARMIPAAIGVRDHSELLDESPFSLGDPDVTRTILRSAGFETVEFVPVREPLYYGPDVDTAYRNVLQLREPQALLNGLSPAAGERARSALRAMLAAHDSRDGVLLGSAAWIVRAM